MKDIYGKASVVSIELLADPNEEDIKAELQKVMKGVDQWWAWLDLKHSKDAFCKYLVAYWAADALQEFVLPYWRGDTDASSKLYDEFASQRLSLRFEAFRQFLANPWFERMWVVQETALAGSIRVRYEGVEMQWDQLVMASDLLTVKQSTLGVFLMDGLSLEPGRSTSTRSPRPIAFVTLPSLVAIRRRAQSGKDRPLAELLTWLRSHKAKDLRDKIFAIHGICSPLPARLLPPDYSDRTKPRKVFVNAASCLVYEGATARMLAAAGTPLVLDSDSDNELTNLPSWVPDWSTRLAARQLSFMHDDLDYRAGGTGKIQAEIRTETLHIGDGYLIDTIAELGSVLKYYTILDVALTEPEMDEWMDVIRSSVSLILRPQLTERHYLGKEENGTLREAVWRTAVGNRVFKPNGNPAPSQLSYGFDEFMKFCSFPEKNRTVAMDWTDQMKMHTSRYVEFLRAAITCWGGRRLCVTSKGYVGAVPPSTQVGDEVVVFAGMQTPSVLCRVEFQQHRYVGECYIHGIMNGEVLKEKEAGEWFKII
jgi:hypothetical protein